MLLRELNLLLLAALMTGCACGPAPSPATQPALSTRTEATPMKKPFMFGEAKLPAGFPPPGPVGQVMVREYPASRAARVRSETLGNADDNGMFMPLFNHIKSHDIAMTSPVDITWSEAKPVAMAFVYADPAIGAPGKEGVVEVTDQPALTVVSIGVRGSYNRERFNAALAQLNAWLDQHPGKYGISGPPRYLAYNSPFVPWFLRFGEVQIPVTPK